MVLPVLLFAVVASDAPIQLHWAAPAECPSESEVVQQILKHRTSQNALKAMDAQVTVTPVGGGYRLELTTDSAAASGHRFIDVETCEQAVEAAAVIIALAWDVEAVDAGPALPLDAAVPPVAVDAGPDAGTDGVLAPGFQVAAFMGADVGLLPQPAGQASVSAGITLGNIEVNAVGLFTFGQTQVAGPSAASRLQYAPSFGGGLKGCYSWNFDTIDFLGCVAVNAGVLKVAGLIFDSPLTGSAPWLRILGGPALRWHFSKQFSLRANADAGASVVAPEFHFLSGTPAFSVGLFALQLSAGLEAHFP